MTEIDRRTFIAITGAAAATLAPSGSADAWQASPATDNEKGNKMSNVTTRITTDKRVPGYWRVTLNHPPINTVDDQMYDEIFDLVEAIEAEPSLKVVTFESANPDYFLAHYGVGNRPAASASRVGSRRRPGSPTAMFSASLSSVAGRAAAEASSLWPATCASLVERKPSLVSRRSDSVLLRAGAPSRACPFWSDDRGQSRSRLAVMISMPR